MRKFLSGLLGSVGLIASTAAFACGQTAPIGPAKPGSHVHVRGYGYGFEGGERLVTLVWVGGGDVAGTAFIDANGDFSAEIIAPNRPGEYQLIVREGDADPAPNTVIIPVVGAET